MREIPDTAYPRSEVSVRFATVCRQCLHYTGAYSESDNLESWLPYADLQIMPLDIDS